MFNIDVTDSASDDLEWFRKHEQTTIADQIELQLTHQPNVEARNRKRLRPNQVAEWELRIDNFRVFYNVDENARVVEVKAIMLKVGSKLVARGKEIQL